MSGLLPTRPSTRFLLSLVALVLSAVCSQAGPVAWKANRSGDWSDAANWEGGSVPQEGDDVQITAPGARVVLSRSPPYLRSVTLARTLTFSGWQTKLRTASLTVKAGGLITHEGPFK